MTNVKILVIQDDNSGAAYLGERLKGLGYTVCAIVSSGQEAFEKAAGLRPDLVLIDLGLKGEGVEVGERIGSRFDIPVIYLTDEAKEHLLQRAETTNAFGYVLKPFDERQLHLNIKTALSMHEKERKHEETVRRLEQTIDGLEVQTHAMDTIFESISDGVVVADMEGQFKIFNPGAEQIVGFGMLNIPPDQWSEQYGVFYLDRKTHVPIDQLPLVRAIQGETTDEIELFIRNVKRPEGVYISVNGRPLRKEGRKQSGGVIAFRDITKRKMAETKLKETMQELRNQSELMETTFKSISEGIVVADAEGNFLYVNPGAEHIVGMGATDTSPSEWAERYGTFYLDKETPVKTEDLPLIRAIFGGESVDEQDLFIRNEKRPEGVYIRVSARPLLNEVGGVRGGVIVLRDVTEHILAQEMLSRAFDQGRLEIVDTILHNIGNAVNSVAIGIETVRQSLTNNHLILRLRALADAIKAHQDDWSEYIKNDPQGQKTMPFIIALAEDFTRHHERIAETVERVRERAKHIADIVRTQKSVGSERMDRKDIDLRHAISSAIRVLQDSLNKRSINIAVDCENAPKEIRTQESQFHQMIVNLVKNAMEAIDDLAASGRRTESPRIEIRAYVEGEFLNLDVSDNGIGIVTKNQKMLFVAGYTTKKSGSGFGLHSIANFVRGSGGQIHPMSDGIGKGTTMRIMLRLSAVAPWNNVG